MIHHWECIRCTHEWQSCCFSEFMEKDENRERNHRQLSSHLCWDCFEQLETGEIAGLEIFSLFFYLQKKSRRHETESVLGTYLKDGLYNEIRYSGMCHEYRRDVYGPDGTIIEKSNFESGFTAEQTELYKIVSEVKESYRSVVIEQRTAKRKELDEYQKGSGYRFFGSQPRPENFIGDPQGKQRFEVICGIDFSTGEFIPPTIQMSKSGLPDLKD